MTTRQKCRLRMFCALTGLLDQYPDLVMQSSVLPALFKSLNETIEKILITDGSNNKSTRKDRTMKTRRTEDLFDEAWETVQRIDAAAEIVRKNDEGFFRDYRAARKILEKSNGPVALQGKVVDSSTLRPLSCVMLHFCQEGKEYRRLSAAKGGFRFKKLPPGRYIITAKKHGYHENSFFTHIIENKRADIILAMIRKAS